MDIQANKQALKSVLVERMGNQRAETAVEIIEAFDSYLIDQNISKTSLFEMSSPLAVEGIIVRLKCDSKIRRDFKGRLFFIERGLLHYKTYLNTVQDDWMDDIYEKNLEVAEVSDEIGSSSNSSEYDADRITKMLDDPEAFIKELARKGRR